jgi:hypothetical protein
MTSTDLVPVPTAIVVCGDCGHIDDSQHAAEMHQYAEHPDNNIVSIGQPAAAEPKAKAPRKPRAPRPTKAERLAADQATDRTAAAEAKIKAGNDDIIASFEAEARAAADTEEAAQETVPVDMADLARRDAEAFEAQLPDDHPLTSASPVAVPDDETADEVAAVIQMVGYRRPKTDAKPPATAAQPAPKAPKTSRPANTTAAKPVLYLEAVAAKKAGARGKGRKIEAGELAEYVARVRQERPESTMNQELEIAYWIEKFAITRTRWNEAWAQTTN